MDYILKVFDSVAKYGSFSRAADELFMSQSSVSYSIKKLEEELHITLFERNKNRIVLTPAGMEVYAFSQNYLQNWKSLLSSLEKFNEDFCGTLRIGATALVSGYIIERVLNPYKKASSGIDIIMVVGNSNETMEKLEEGIIDFAIVSEPVADRSYYSFPILEDELVVVVNHEHPWKDLKSIPVDLLPTQPYISREEGSGTRKIISRSLQDTGRSYSMFNTLFTVGNVQAVIQSIKRGLGYSIISKIAIKDELRKNSLKAIPISDLSLKRNFLFLTPKSNLKTKYKKSFVDIAKKSRGPLPCAQPSV